MQIFFAFIIAKVSRTNNIGKQIIADKTYLLNLKFLIERMMVRNLSFNKSEGLHIVTLSANLIANNDKKGLPEMKIIFS